MKSKFNIGIVFGGRSGEHEVSLASATSIINTLDKSKYEGLTNLKTGNVTPLDAVFPVLHGTFGEDGTVQGLLDLAEIPYVGAGTCGSAVGMDKIIQKEIARQIGIKVAPSIWFLAKDYWNAPDKIIKDIEEKFSYPYFVKPCNSGSSVGISKAHNRNELKSSIEDAARYDTRILVEKGIENGKEIEISVLGNDDLVLSLPGEIFSSNEFYDYDAKYVDGKSKTVVPADLPQNIVKTIQDNAAKIFKAAACSGMARVDFLVSGEDAFFNELNTIPGFTSISMYPKMLAASGISFGVLIDKLIELAIERGGEKKKLLTSYHPKKEWYR
ncbi:MAG: D-alanine--D-alanine ligase [Deltaproteobacteria bacterium]|nr:D-alanine--D-alanine ligase [Deltaproteobacteria bacterium]